MGNSSSKQGSQKGFPLTRTDTGGSGKSSRSLRSRVSLLKEDNNSIEGSRGMKSPRVGSRKSSFSSTTGNNNDSKYGGGMDSSGIPSEGGSDKLSSTQDNSTLISPTTGILQTEPKEPILKRSSSSGENEKPLFDMKNDGSNSNSLAVEEQSIHSISRTSTRNSHQTNSSNSQSLRQINQGEARLASGEGLLSSSLNQEAPTDSANASPTPQNDNNVASEINPLDMEYFIQRLLDASYNGKKSKSVCLKSHEIQRIGAKAREIFLLQPSLLELSPPVKVVGDVHGQYCDLIRIFTKCGFPPQTNYLFLGDYVDRGKQSLETILLLLCYKIKYPENFFLLRGNHECANVTRVYGFYDECKRRSNIKTWKLFIDTFNTLPIAAIVADKIFCVHGGLSPVLNSLDEIRNIARPTDVPDYGLLNDLLWSDPADTMNEWEDNERGVSYVFSKVAINKFLLKFGFDLVCRAHMVVEDGYEFFNDRTLVTVFSAPNYCGEFDNWGAVMSVSEELLCLFELLDPLDGMALKQAMKKGKVERKKFKMQQAQQQQEQQQ